MTHVTIAQALLPVSTRTKRVILVLTGTLFTALCAQIIIPLPFTPVPLTGQTFGVLLTAVLLGSQMARWSLGLYLVGGTVGLPIFAGATGGWARLAGPTGGYLLGFILAAYLVGSLAERGWDRHLPSSLLAIFLGELVIYLPGLLWLSRFAPSQQVLAMGLFPFIPGDLIKIALIGTILPVSWRFLDKAGERR